MSATLVEDSPSVLFAPRETMAKKKTMRQIRVGSEVADMADRLAALQSPPQTTPEFLTAFLYPHLKKELQKALDRAQRELKDSPDPSS